MTGTTAAERAAHPFGTPEERRAAFREGARDFLPALPAIVAWGIVTGVAMVQFGLALAPALGLHLTAFAATAQIASVPLIVAGAPLAVVILTALMMNLRFVIYSAALRAPLQRVPFGRRMLEAYLISDISVAMFLEKTRRRPTWPARDAYFLGMGAINAVVWHAASLVGIFASTSFPRTWGLEFAGLLALVALLVPMCARVPGAVATVVAGACGVATLHWPARLGLVFSFVAGLVAAVIAERWSTRRGGGPAT
jgi:predicted branched-subunit amino acid permease